MVAASTWKLGDFVTFCKAGDPMRSFTSMYSAPELARSTLKGESVAATHQMDLWSTGLVLLETAENEPFLLRGADRDAALQQMSSAELSEELMNLISNHDAPLASLLQDMLQAEASKRKQVGTLLEDHSSFLGQDLGDMQLDSPTRKTSATSRTYAFLSHTQRDAEAKLLALELYSELKEREQFCWLDVRSALCSYSRTPASATVDVPCLTPRLHLTVPERDAAAMKRGVEESTFVIAIISDNGTDSYFSREMCRQELMWAEQSGKIIVPVVASEDKKRIGAFIADGKNYGLDFSKLNICTFDRWARDKCRRVSMTSTTNRTSQH